MSAASASVSPITYTGYGEYPLRNDKYKAKYNQDVVLYAPQGYDAFNVFVDAMKRANSVDSAKILEKMPSTDYKGITGPIKFDDKGDIKDGPITIFKAVGGKMPIIVSVAQPKTRDDDGLR